MFDFTSLNLKQKQAIIDLMQLTINNPIEMLKIYVFQRALTLRDWVEKNHTSNLDDFRLIWTGFETQVNQLFKEFHQEIAHKCNIPIKQ